MTVTESLYYIVVGVGKNRSFEHHRSTWSEYTDGCTYGLEEVRRHALEVKKRSSTGRRKVTIVLYTATAEAIEII